MFKYKLITLMLVALYCVLQVSEAFESAWIREVADDEKWNSLDVTSPDLIYAVKDGIREYELSNNVTHKFAISDVVTAWYHWESSSMVEYITIAKIKETSCPRDSDVDANLCKILENEDPKVCWIHKKQPYHASGTVFVYCD